MSLILEDESKRQKLNGITHPRIFRRMLWEIAGFASRGHNYAVLDVPLLFESSGRLVKWFHKIIGDIYVPKCWVDFSFNQTWLQFKGNPWLFLVLKLQTSEPSKNLRVKLFYYYLSTYSALFNGYYIHLNTLYGKKWWWKRSRKHYFEIPSAFMQELIFPNHEIPKITNSVTKITIFLHGRKSEIFLLAYVLKLIHLLEQIPIWG